MNYETFGPFEVPRKDAKTGRVLDFDKGVLNEFWRKIDETHPGLSGAVGCYIFAIQAPRGFTPWYVGKTEKSFKGECFELQKKEKYRNVFDDILKGTPVLILVARCTPKTGKLAKPPNPKSGEADYVEQLLINKALSKNPQLANIKNTRFFRDIIVPGVLNSPKGKPSPGSKLLKSVLERNSSTKKR